MYNKYEIGGTEHFNQTLYPQVEEEVSVLVQNIGHIPAKHKSEILISFLKDHSIKTEWLEDNNEVARLITSGFLRTSHIESLFTSCRNNPGFLKEFEQYLNGRFV